MTAPRPTAPADRISLGHKVVYGVGGFVNNLLASAIGGMTVVLVLALGMDVRLVGLVGALPRLTDAITDPLMGFISDRTRSRWGRRRPWLFVGAVTAGIIFVLLWQMPAPTQLRLKLVDYGADGVYGAVPPEEGRGLAGAVGDWARSALSLERIDDAEHELAVRSPALRSGVWVSLELPLADFTELRTREHLSRLVLAGDPTELYVANVYFYREAAGVTADAAAGIADPAAAGIVPPAAAEPQGGPQPRGPPPPEVPTAPAGAVISLLGGSDDLPGISWSGEGDLAEVSELSVGGARVQHYTDLFFADIEFGEPVDATAMTHLRLDVWTPDIVNEGWSEGSYFYYFLIGSIIFFIGYTIFATPWVALGYELTPDYHERTRLMGVQNFVSNIPFVVAPWFLFIMANPAWFRNQMDGARGLALAVAVTTIVLGVLPAIILRERVMPAAAAAASFRHGVREFFGGLWQTLRSGPFLMLCAATFLIFNGFIMISSYQIFVLIYYVAGGNQTDGAWLAGLAGTVGMISNFLVIALVAWLGTRIGKRNAFFVSTGVSIFGYGLKWFCYTPELPLLALVPAPFMAFGLGGLFTLMGSLIADVVDLDELKTGERREGMFGSIYWWVVKLGQSAAIAAGGFMLAWTGFEAGVASQSAQTLVSMRALDAFVPVLTSLVAIVVMFAYPITERRAGEIRAELERRRGAVPLAAS